MSFAKVTIGDKSPEIINTIIEIPRGSHVKYEYNEDLDVICMDRVLHSAVFYPTEYGFIPETRSEDGDHLDVMVIASEPLLTGSVVAARVIGVLDMEDDKGQDWKIVAVAEKDPRVGQINDLADLDEHHKNEIQHFFEVYKNLENKEVNVKGWLGKQEALKIIIQGQDRWQAE